MADYHVGSGQTYATIADALVDIVALGATQWTEAQNVIIHAGTYAETLTYGTTYGWNLGASPNYPLVFKKYNDDAVTISGSGGVLVGQNYMSHIRIENLTFGYGKLQLTNTGGYVTFDNCIIPLNDSSNMTIQAGSPYAGSVTFKNCQISFTGTNQMFVSNQFSFDYIFDTCIINSTNSASIVYRLINASIVMRNCRIYNARLAHSSVIKFADIRHCTFNNGVAGSGIIDDTVTCAEIKNCIFKNLSAIFSDTTSKRNVNTNQIYMDGNVYDNVTAFAIGSVSIANLAAAKAAGIEGDNSLEQAVTFQSTDYTNADFLKISTTIGNAVSAGINEDAFGTYRHKYSDLDAGAHQYIAATTPSNDDVVSSAGGNYSNTNLLPSNVKAGVTFGLAETGTYDNATDPDYVLLSGGGNYSDTNLVPSNVKLGITYGISQTGTYDPSGEPPRQPTIHIIDSGDGSHAVATISGSDTGTTNNIYTAKYGTTEWVLSGTRTGNGTVTLTLSSGSYWAYCDSSLESCSSRSITAIVHIANLDEAVIVDIAEYIKDEINNSDISDVAERNYIQHERLEKITGTEIWVQPNEHRIERATRTQDQHEYDIDVSLFKRCKTTAETDDLVLLSEEIYQFLRSLEINGSLPSVVTMPTMFSPDDLLERNLFASVITVTVKGIS